MINDHTCKPHNVEGLHNIPHGVQRKEKKNEKRTKVIHSKYLLMRSAQGDQNLLEVASTLALKRGEKRGGRRRGCKWEKEL